MNKKLPFVLLLLLLLIVAIPVLCKGRVNRKVADKLLLFQNDNGGWVKNYQWNAPADSPTNKEKLEGKGEYSSTIDNGATHEEIRYLSSAYLKLKDKRYKDAALKGINYLLEAQYDNGGWPQFYPYEIDSYKRHITFNDDAMIGAMRVLRDVAQNKPQFSFTGKDMQKRAAQAVKKGIDCILKCQVIVNGKKTAWCAQHDEITFQPRMARSYELVSLSGSESVEIIRFLMEIENPTPQIVRAVDAAVAWFDEAKIEGVKLKTVRDKSMPQGRDIIIVNDPKAAPMWARFYEIGTNKPIYSSRDGIIKRNLSEISHERRNNYSWIGWYAAELLKKDYPNWLKKIKTPLPDK